MRPFDRAAPQRSSHPQRERLTAHFCPDETSRRHRFRLIFPFSFSEVRFPGESLAIARRLHYTHQVGLFSCSANRNLFFEIEDRQRVGNFRHRTPMGR